MSTETNYGVSAYSEDIASDGKILVAVYAIN
jgi:hypothetical protein